jgi:Flp pilus assembly protein TadG
MTSLGNVVFRPRSPRRKCAGLSGIVARVWRENAGSSLVEFGLSAVVLVMVLLGIIECCFALYVNNYVSDAARAATRYAAVRGSSCTGMPDCGITSAQIQTYLRGITYPGVTPGNLTATATWLSLNSGSVATWTACANQCNAPTNSVKVQVNYAFTLGIPFWRTRSLTLSSTSQMVISN